MNYTSLKLLLGFVTLVGGLALVHPALVIAAVGLLLMVDAVDDRWSS